jgi:exosortase
VTAAADATSTRRLSSLLDRPWPAAMWLPAVVAAVAFGVLFASPAAGVAHQWWTDPDMGHGLLLFPVSLWLAWRSGLLEDTRPDVAGGTVLLVGAVLVRALGSLAAEFFTQRFSILLALAGVTVFCFGWKQLRHWWLPFTLLFLAIPLPDVIVNRLAIPLQFRASRMGTALLQWRHVPVLANGNVIVIPEGRLFVAEACSGLRSLTALMALGVMIGGLYLGTVTSRIVLLLLAVPVAVLVNAFRVFLTAFLMHFVDPALGQGFMHASEGWALFLVSMVILAAITVVLRFGEQWWRRARGHHA